jgi:hypothetical protein
MSSQQERPVDVTDNSTRHVTSSTNSHLTERDGNPDTPDDSNLAEITVWHDNLYDYFKRPKQVARPKNDPFAWPWDWGKPKTFARPKGWTCWKDYYRGKGLLNHRDGPKGQGVEAIESGEKPSPRVNGAGSGSLADQISRKSQIQERDLAFRRLFELKFPNGYTTIPNSSKDLLCGIHALTDSLRAQLPDEHITLRDRWKTPTRGGTILELPRQDLFDDINRAFLPESSFKPNEPFGGFVWKSKETVAVIGANLEDERSFYHLALLTSGLKRWGRNRGLNLALGCVYGDGSCRAETGEDRAEDDDRQQDAADDAEAQRAKSLPEVTIWIRSNCDIQTGLPEGKRAGHYEGIRANKPGGADQGNGGSGSSTSKKRPSEGRGDAGDDSNPGPWKKQKSTPLDPGGSNLRNPSTPRRPNDDDSPGTSTTRKRSHEGDRGEEGHGKDHLSNKKPKTISDADIDPAAAKALFDSRFVNGYSTIPNHGTRLQCGIEALTDSLRAQLPVEAVSLRSKRGKGDDYFGYIKELDRALLFQDIEWAMDPKDTREFQWTEVEKEELWVQGLDEDKGDYNVSALSACLRRWGRKRAERDLCLGYRLANGTCYVVHYHGSEDTIIWISSGSETGRSASDDHWVSSQTGGKKRKQHVVYDHYEGIRPNEQEKEEDVQDKEVGSDDSLFNGSSLPSSQGGGSTGGKDVGPDEDAHMDDAEDAQDKEVGSDDSLFNGSSLPSSQRRGSTGGKDVAPDEVIHMDDAHSETTQKPLPTTTGTESTSTTTMIPGLFLLQEAASRGAITSQTHCTNTTCPNQDGAEQVKHTTASTGAGNAADANTKAGGLDSRPEPGSQPDANPRKRDPRQDAVPADLNVPSSFKRHYTGLLHRISTRLNPLYPPPSVPLQEEAAVLLPLAQALQSTADAWSNIPFIQFRHRQLNSTSEKMLKTIHTEIKDNMGRAETIREELATRLALGLPHDGTPSTPAGAAPPDFENHRQWLMKVDRPTLVRRQHELLEKVKSKTADLESKKKNRSQTLTRATDGPETCLGFDTFTEAREAVMGLTGIVDRLGELQQFAAVGCESFAPPETAAQPERSVRGEDQVKTTEEEDPVQSSVEVGHGKEGGEEHGTPAVEGEKEAEDGRGEERHPEEDSSEEGKQEDDDDREQDGQEEDVGKGNRKEEDNRLDDNYIEDSNNRQQEEQVDEPGNDSEESEEDEKARVAAEEAKQKALAEKAERRKEELRKVSLNELEREVAREEGLPDELGEWS